MRIRPILRKEAETSRDYNNKELKIHRNRLIQVGTLSGLFLSFLLYSAFRIQVVQGAKHRDTVVKLSFTNRKLPVERGFILDRKHQPIVVPTEMPSAALDPLKLAYVLMERHSHSSGRLSGKENKKKREKIALNQNLQNEISSLSSEFADALHEDRYIISEKLFAAIMRGQRFLYLKRHITPEEIVALKKINLPKGVLFYPNDISRHYPERSLAAHVVGFTSVDGEGMEGVEKYFNIELTGTTSSIKAQKDAKSGLMFIKGLPDIQVSGANNVVLTIDSRIQKDTEKILQNGLEKFKASYGSAIVMDAKTGEILALANAPMFDPGRKHEVNPQFYRNRAVVDAFELGSVVKPLTMLGAIAAGNITPDTDVPMDFSAIWKDGRPWTPKDHINVSMGTIKPVDIIAKSSNKGIAKVAELMGERSLYTLFMKLGFGFPTGIELPSEATGILPPLKQWTSKVNLATHSYGHGITLSLMQLVQAYSVFANDGYIVKPHVVRYIVDDNNEIISCNSPVACGRKPTRRKVVANKKAVREVMEMMKAVVTRGTGTHADMRKWGYSAAGKTGTAELILKGVKDGIAYSQDRNRVTFAGLVPADNPRVVIAIMFEDPQGDPDTATEKEGKIEMRKDAGYTAAPIFAEVARNVMYRLGVPPDTEVTVKKKGKEIKSELPVTKPVFPPLPSPERIVMPDFTGKSLASALEVISELGIHCKISGHGAVISQNPPPGGPLAGCTLTLSTARKEETENK